MSTFRPIFIGGFNEAVFAMHHVSSVRARQTIVWCPPLLHEHGPSVRLFHLVGQALSVLGIESLRIDYRGSGDSSGDTQSLSLESATEDALTACRWIAKNSPGTSVVVAGIRAGATPAAHAARATGLPLLLWQPVTDCAEWLTELQRRDARERASTQRYPFLRPGEATSGGKDDLMGFRLGSTLRTELEHAAEPGNPPDLLVETRDKLQSGGLSGADNVELPDGLAQWTDRVDMPGNFPQRSVDRFSESLDDRLRWMCREPA